jgi:hypothetical protein
MLIFWRRTILGALTLAAYGLASPADVQSPSYSRIASRAEIIGAWAILPQDGLFYRYRYVAITADGRVGWFASNSEPQLKSARTLEAIIDGKVKSDGIASGWNACKVSDGSVSETPANPGTETNYDVQIVTSSTGADPTHAWITAQPGDLIMRQMYRIPANWDPKQGAPEVLGARPLLLHALAR